MTALNIRNEADRAAIEAAGYVAVTVIPRGEAKGQVISRHRTATAAEKRAAGRDIAVVIMAGAEYY